MAVWNPVRTGPPQINFETTSDTIDAPNWNADGYVDVIPRGCISITKGDHICVPDPNNPPEPSSVAGCDDCGKPMCVEGLPEAERFRKFPISSQVKGCAETDIVTLADVRAAFEAAKPIALANAFAEEIDPFLTADANVIEDGAATCADVAVAQVVEARADLGLATGALVMSWHVYSALRKEGLITEGAQPRYNGIPVTTGPGLAPQGLTNITGPWVAALGSPPGSATTESLYSNQNPVEGQLLPQPFYDEDSACWCPAEKQYGVVAADVGCVRWALVCVKCECGGS